MRKTVLLIILLLFCISTFAQEDIFPDKKGSELINHLYANYKPTGVLTYNDARDELWGAIAKRNSDSLHGVYTDYTVYISPGASRPRTEAYNQGIDCEHTWPQSLGASGDAKSDMHHLFPTRTQANSARGNHPFDEIGDQYTDKWFYKTNILTVKPTSGIDHYSELLDNSAFEPREDHKGNVARAMFYFYTQYKGQANQSFFYIQKVVLYQWHYLDPVDEEEKWRNNFIASKQGNKNPFILDSTLIRRAYFPHYVIPNSVLERDDPQIEIHPNPASDFINVKTGHANYYRVEIFNLSGELLLTEHFNDRSFTIPIEKLQEGLYFIHLKDQSNSFYYKFLKYD